MQSIIQNNAKKFVVVAILAVILGVFAFGDDILAVILPNAADLSILSYELDESEYDFTGSANEPKVLSVSFQDKKGKSVIRENKEIEIVSYKENVQFGNGDIEIKVKGYIGTALLEDAFLIKPAVVEGLNIVQVTESAVKLEWNEVAGAQGYQIFKGDKDGNNFICISENNNGSMTTFEDTDVTYNRVYQYKIRAFAQEVCEDTATEESSTQENTGELETIYGDESECMKCYTPLETPVLSEVEKQTYDSILVKWNAVEGAIGYQVYRSEKKDGEYNVIAEITNPEELSYTDKKCECGREYFYYVKACQKLETESVYGKASNVDSSRTVPETTKLNGKVVDSDTKVELTWRKSNGAQGYEIYKKTESGDYKLVKKIEDAAVSSWSESGLKKETNYTYRIRPYCTLEGTTITGNYSNTYTKKAVIVNNNVNNPASGNVSSGNTSSNTSSGSASSGSFSSITKYAGTPYVYGGTTPNGWDCSGFTQWALKTYFGVSIPRTAASQGSSGTAISVSNRSAWKPGDILAYSDGSRISHVTLYLGNGQIMHALNSKYDTVIQSVDYYENWDQGNRLVAVRRYR